MKTLDEILEGVTAGGQWRSGVTPVTDRSLYSSSEIVAPVFCLKTDAAYAAWAARHAPVLVRALEKLVVMHATTEHWIAAVDEGNAALAEALKD